MRPEEKKENAALKRGRLLSRRFFNQRIARVVFFPPTSAAPNVEAALQHGVQPDIRQTKELLRRLAALASSSLGARHRLPHLFVFGLDTPQKRGDKTPSLFF